VVRRCRRAVAGQGRADAAKARIGAAWPHSSSTRFNIPLEAQPMGDHIVLTEPKVE
jgi:hypothetical protein